MTDEQHEPIQRWRVKRRLTLVTRILKGETLVAEIARAQRLRSRALGSNYRWAWM